MEFRNQDEERAHMSSSLNYNHNSNTNHNPIPNPNHSSIRISSFSSPRPTTGTATTGTSSRNGHQIDPPPQTASKFQPNPNTLNISNGTATYHECLKNHAAAVGGHVLDGCGEFMTDPDNPLSCAACTCHRSFHRKESVGTSRISTTSHVSVPLLLPPTHHPYHYQGRQYQSGGLSGGTTTESSSEERIGTGSAVPTQTASKKRYRTKFTPEQKEKMFCFAERVGWRIQKQDEHLVEQFCSEVGVRRQVLKVWMHNNKNNGKKQEQQSQAQQEVHLQQSPNQQLQWILEGDGRSRPHRGPCPQKERRGFTYGMAEEFKNGSHMATVSFGRFTC
ncbi:Zinc finger family protein [Rhynchospora pubera]|uniref:Zinc finger family protein n=1 Tax=Rhynchospora pubera TaxID=906938 RepID=A0AAV8EH71_9POAL|nr:Zinc finger family protein [Rhynchospora pubera]